MKEHQVPYWACIILANTDINFGHFGWASFWLVAGILFLFLDYKYGEV